MKSSSKRDFGIKMIKMLSINSIFQANSLRRPRLEIRKCQVISIINSRYLSSNHCEANPAKKWGIHENPADRYYKTRPCTDPRPLWDPWAIYSCICLAKVPLSRDLPPRLCTVSCFRCCCWFLMHFPGST